MPASVSAVVPIYNGATWLASTIESLLAQTCPLEVILVDDGSTDNSLDVARSYERENISVFAQKNRGGAAARNRGFMESHGDFIQFLDQDDLLAPDKIEQQLTYCEFRDDVVVSGRWVRFKKDSAGIFGGWGPHESIAQDLTPLEWLLRSHMVPTCAWLIPRRLVKEAGLWNEELAANPDDDGEFFMRAIAKSERVLFCPEAKAYFRTENPNAAGNNRSWPALKSILGTCGTFRDVILSLDNSDPAKEACARRYRALMYMAYPRFPDLVEEAERMIESLGCSARIPEGTPMYERFARLLGWKASRYLQDVWSKVRLKGSK